MGRLEGKAAIITGAANGIGFEGAKQFVKEGAKVLAIDIDENGLANLKSEVESEGGTIEVRRVDITKKTEVDEAVAFAAEIFGKIDVLYNNAGGISDGGFLNLTEELFDKIFALNVKGTIFTSQAAIPYMLKQGGGSIINTLSGSVELGDLYMSAYASSKGALKTLSMYMATQFGKQNIRVNMIQPGLILTQKAESKLPEATSNLYLENNLLPMHGRPEDIAKAAIYLASDESKFLTNTIIKVDGGAMSHSPEYSAFMKAAKIQNN